MERTRAWSLPGYCKMRLQRLSFTASVAVRGMFCCERVLHVCCLLVPGMFFCGRLCRYFSADFDWCDYYRKTCEGRQFVPSGSNVWSEHLRSMVHSHVTKISRGTFHKATRTNFEEFSKTYEKSAGLRDSPARRSTNTGHQAAPCRSAG